jgi:hypothetical protein
MKIMQPLGHEKWFLDASDYPTDWSFVFRPLTLALLATAVAVTIGWRLAANRLPSPELRVLRPLGRLTPYLPRLLAIHLGVTLLTLAARGQFLSANLDLHHLPVPAVVGLLEGALGVWFISGVRLKAAALGLILLGPLALAATGPVSLLESADLLGIAGFLALLPPSADRYGAVEPDERRLKHALFVLKLGVAAALITLAFSEKLANPAMAEATLAKYPQLHILPLHPPAFVAVAGAIEVLFGLLVLSGALPQVAVIVAAVPFNLTLLVFGSTELLGHLPVYGVFLVLLAYGSDPRTTAAVRWLPPIRRPRVAPTRGRTRGSWPAPGPAR